MGDVVDITQKEEVVAEKPVQSSTEPVQEAPKDYKIAEIWIKDGRVMLDATPEFYFNKLLAIGILEYCKDIIKTTEAKEDKPKIQVASGMSSLRNFLSKKR
jgi:hypothetical protein